MSYMAIFTLTMFVSCGNLTVPESVTVKSKASYSVPLGKTDVLLKEKMNSSKIQDAISGDDDDEKNKDSSNNIEVYQYEPTENDNETLSYIINYPLEEVSLSVTDSDTDLKSIPINTTISLPDFNKRVSSKLELAPTTFLVSEGSSGLVSVSNITININSPTYEEIEIYNGTMEVSITKTDSVSYSMLTIITIIDENGNKFSSEQTDLANGGTVSIPLDKARLSQSFKVAINAYMSGTSGNPSDIHTYTLKMTPKDIKLSKITGLTMTADELGDDANITITQDVEMTSLNEYLEEATIKKGSVNMKCALPTGWSGITCDTAFSVSGGLNLSKEEFTNISNTENDVCYLLAKEAKLDGKTITKDKMQLSGTANIKFNEATLIFENGEIVNSLDAEGVLSIEEIKTLKLNIQKLVDFNGSIDSGLNLQDMMSDFVSEKYKNLIDNIELCNIESYFSANKPEIDALKNIGFEGKIKVSYEKDKTSKETYLVGDSSSYENIKMTNDESLSKLAIKDEDDEDNLIIKGSNVFSNYTKIKDITEIINEKPESLKFDYNLKLASGNSIIELTGDDFNTLTNGAAIGLNLVLVLPMQLKLKDAYDAAEVQNRDDGYITIDNVFDLLEDEDEDDSDDKDEEDDLLGRKDASETEKWEKYSKLLKEITLTYKIQNDTGFECEAKLIDDNCKISKDISFTSDKANVLCLSDEDIINVCKNYPFDPKIQLQIKIPEGDGLVTIKRNSEFGINATVKVKLDGDLEVWNKEDGIIFNEEETEDEEHNNG